MEWANVRRGRINTSKVIVATQPLLLNDCVIVSQIWSFLCESSRQSFYSGLLDDSRERLDLIGRLQTSGMAPDTGCNHNMLVVSFKEL